MPRKPVKPQPKKKGRPSKYRPEMIEQARRLTMMGQTMAEVAAFFDVTYVTLHEWRLTKPEFDEAFSLSLKDANAKVELSLYKMSTGYWMDEEEIKVIDGQIVRVPVKKFYPPVPSAAIYWSKVKMGWRDDVAEAEPPPAADTPINVEATRQIARRAALLLLQGGKKESA